MKSSSYNNKSNNNNNNNNKQHSSKMTYETVATTHSQSIDNGYCCKTTGHPTKTTCFLNPCDEDSLTEKKTPLRSKYVWLQLKSINWEGDNSSPKGTRIYNTEFYDFLLPLLPPVNGQYSVARMKFLLIIWYFEEKNCDAIWLGLSKRDNFFIKLIASLFLSWEFLFL